MIRILNPWMERTTFDAMLKEMLQDGYRAVAAFDGDEMLGLSGFWLRTRFWCGRQLDIDNFIVLPQLHGKGIGKKLAAWLEKTAKREGCELIVLDTYVERTGAQEFYGKQGFAKTGYHMTKIPGSRQLGALPYSVNRAFK